MIDLSILFEEPFYPIVCFIFIERRYRTQREIIILEPACINITPERLQLQPNIIILCPEHRNLRFLPINLSSLVPNHHLTMLHLPLTRLLDHITYPQLLLLLLEHLIKLLDRLVPIIHDVHIFKCKL